MNINENYVHHRSVSAGARLVAVAVKRWLIDNYNNFPSFVVQYIYIYIVLWILAGNSFSFTEDAHILWLNETADKNQSNKKIQKAKRSKNRINSADLWF